ncbi:MAG: hypothetical protein PUB42_05965 [Firmicutes bacterium]|nr:hypothetical protein [Bacillota bacterium]
MTRITFNSIHTRKMHRKIICAALVIIIIPFFILTLISYTTAEDERRMRTSKLNEQYIENTSSIFSLIINQINNIYMQAMVNDDILSFECSYIGKQYEEERARGIEPKGKFLDIYLDSKKNMHDFLKEIALSNKYIKSIYFYDYEKHLILTNTGVDYNVDVFYDRDWMEKDTEGEYMTILPTRQANEGPGIKSNVISVIFQSINKPNNRMVVNISYDALLENVVKLLPNKGYSDFLILNSDRDLIFASDNEIYDKYRNYEFSTNEKPVSSFGSKYLVSSMYSNEYKLFFAVVSDTHSMYRSGAPIQLIFWIMTVLVVIVSIFIITYIINYVSNPMLNVADSFFKGDKNKEKGDMSLLFFMNNILKENADTGQWFEENKMFYRDSFILSLLEINEFDETEMANNFKMMDIDMDQKNIFVAVIVTDVTEYRNKQKVSEMMLLDALIENMISEIFSDKFKFVSAQKSEGEFAMLINAEEKNEDEVKKLLSCLLDEFTDKTGTLCDIGLSGIAKNISDIPRVYEEIMAILKYRAHFLEGRLYCSDDSIIEDEAYNMINYPTYNIKLLANLVSSGDVKNTRECFKDIKNNILISVISAY